MPLSKARDKERKRLSRLESKKVQPKRLYPVQPKDMRARLEAQGIGLDGNRIIKGTIVSRERATFPAPELDADGNPMPSDT